MLGDTTSLGAVALLVALGAANVAVSLLLLRWRDDEPAADRDGRTDAPSDDDQLRCPECATANDPGYTFCRSCVSRLPGEGAATDPGIPRPDRAG